MMKSVNYSLCWKQVSEIWGYDRGIVSIQSWKLDSTELAVDNAAATITSIASTAGITSTLA